MRPTTTTGNRAVPALLGAVVVAIVLGILGMHALNLHGTTGGMDSMPCMAGTSATGHPSGTDDPDAGPAVESGTVATALDSPAHGMGDMGGMVMLCVVMLAAAGIALLVLLLRRAPRSTWFATRPRPAATLLRGLDAARTRTGQPYVWAFSVIRC